MKLHIQGKGPVDLGQKEFLAQGGEGSIYAKANTAYKIFTDPKKMIAVGKIQDLSCLTHSNIIKPEDILLDSKNKPVGYSMKLVKDTYALCQLFTKAFRVRNNITPDMMLALVRKLQEIVLHVHSNQILIVDLNELNFLASQDFKDIFAIDVDSYQTPHFPATALMESVRDRHSKTFSEGTDWFAFAITAFQMFIGIHPYKGKHPKHKTMDERMINNISVFNNEVSIPSACYDFSVIPQSYVDWFKAVLEDGKRVAPPAGLINTINLIHTIKKIVGSNNFEIEKLEEMVGEIIDVWFRRSNKVILTNTGLKVNKDFLPNITAQSQIVFTTKSSTAVSVTTDRHKLELFNVSKNQTIPLNLLATEFMIYDGRIYLKSCSNLIELDLVEVANNIIPSPKVVGQILEQATSLYEGVAIQNLLGSYFISLFPQPGTCYQLRIQELDQYKILDAKFDHNVLMIVGVNNKTGKYDRLIFRFDEIPTQEYDLRIIQDITFQNLNFVVLDTGICVHLAQDANQDEVLEIFSNNRHSATIKVISDQLLSNDMKLLKNGTKLLFSKENKLYSMSMKK